MRTIAEHLEKARHNLAFLDLVTQTLNDDPEILRDRSAGSTLIAASPTRRISTRSGTRTLALRSGRSRELLSVIMLLSEPRVEANILLPAPQ